MIYETDISHIVQGFLSAPERIEEREALDFDLSTSWLKSEKFVDEFP